MKFLSKAITVILLSLCTQVAAQSDTTELSQFIGDWQGEGYFYNVNVAEELGTVRFTLRVTADMEITGSVGQADFIDAEIEVDDWNDGYRIQGTVVGQISPGSDFQKKRLTLLLKGVQDDIIHGDFHLANNFIFDFSMRPGAVTLRRNP